MSNHTKKKHLHLFVKSNSGILPDMLIAIVKPGNSKIRYLQVKRCHIAGGSFSPSPPPSSATRHPSHPAPPLFHACYLFQVQTLIPTSNSAKVKLIINLIDIVDFECVFLFVQEFGAIGLRTITYLKIFNQCNIYN